MLSEFAAACRSTAVAITEGLIAPLSIGDPNQSEIYVYNGIFFSKAEDTKDSFKLCVGDDAYRKCTGRELQNQRLIRALEVEGVGLILCAIIDYKGERIIGQSIIPGIFAQVGSLCRPDSYRGLTSHSLCDLTGRERGPSDVRYPGQGEGAHGKYLDLILCVR